MKKQFFLVLGLCCLVACTVEENRLVQFEKAFSDFERIKNIIEADKEIDGFRYLSEKDTKVYYMQDVQNTQTKSGLMLDIYKDFLINNSYIGEILRYQDFLSRTIFRNSDKIRSNISKSAIEKMKAQNAILDMYAVDTKKFNFVFFYFKYKSLLGDSVMDRGILYSQDIDLSSLPPSSLVAFGIARLVKTKYENWYEISRAGTIL